MRLLPLAEAMLTRSVPVYVHYGITHRCNLTCEMCGLWRLGNAKTEMSLDQIRVMADNLRALGTTAISLGGGEPFLRSDLDQIISTFMSRGIEPRVLTNGLVDNRELLKKVADTGIRHISISFDTPNPETQSEVCHKPEIWDKIIESVCYWGNVLRPRRGLGLFNCVLSTVNYKDVVPILKIAEMYGFQLSLVPIETHAYQENVLSCGSGSEKMKFKPEDRKALEELKNLKGNLFNSPLYLDGMVKYLTGQEHNYNCQAGSLTFSVSPEGNYSMCHYYTGCGDHKETPPIYSPDFVNWYRKTKPYTISKKVRENCRKCFRPCWMEVALSFTKPSSFVNAALKQRPKAIPENLPSAQELKKLLKIGTKQI